MKGSACLLIATFSWSCSRRPQIRNEYLTDPQLAQQSPVIVVGRIEKLERLWHDTQRHGYLEGPADRQPLYWFRVNVDVGAENVLRGDLAAQPIEYNYWLPENAMTGEWNSLIEGARYVHFLRRDGNRLRAVVDMWPAAILVTSGRHASVKATGTMPDRIAWLLFEPGERFDLRYFQLDRAALVASRLVGDSAMLALLEKAAASSDAEIRLEACEELRAYDRQPLPCRN
jgi:hypothetical protein